MCTVSDLVRLCEGLVSGEESRLAVQRHPVCAPAQTPAERHHRPDATQHPGPLGVHQVRERERILFIYLKCPYYG